ncbi:MAG: choloylglycine hydrolase family protein [Deltaproteobacteria bacterium]|nr:choloylglycine hydrolase family protein [Deltaproteobacteria bacterium]
MMMNCQRVACALIAMAAILGAWTADASACTSVRLKADDGAVVYVRSVEFGSDCLTDAALLIVPRGYEITGTAPGGKPGLKWKAKHAMVGGALANQLALIDGMNEKGLAVGGLYLPGFAEYPKVGPDEFAKALAPHEYALWLLTNFATVEEVRKALSQAIVADVVLTYWGFAPPCHWVVHDADGKCIVIEFVKGKMNVHDNPLGVLTNSPTFDWHMTNLRNYINLTATAVPPLEIDGMEFAQFGSGSGMRGIPGDYTPPSRFVRAVALSRTAVPGKTAEEAVQQGFHVLSAFDIPAGSVRDRHGKTILMDRTWYTVAADTKNKRYYFHTNDNRRVRVIDLTKVNLDAKDTVFIPMKGKEDVQDLTPKKK